MSLSASSRHAAHPYGACPSGAVPVGLAAEIDEGVSGERELRWYLLRAEDILVEHAISGELTDAEWGVLSAIKEWAKADS